MTTRRPKPQTGLLPNGLMLLLLLLAACGPSGSSSGRTLPPPSTPDNGSIIPVEAELAFQEFIQALNAGYEDGKEDLAALLSAEVSDAGSVFDREETIRRFYKQHVLSGWEVEPDVGMQYDGVETVTILGPLTFSKDGEVLKKQSFNIRFIETGSGWIADDFGFAHLYDPDPSPPRLQNFLLRDFTYGEAGQTLDIDPFTGHRCEHVVGPEPQHTFAFYEHEPGMPVTQPVLIPFGWKPLEYVPHYLAEVLAPFDGVIAMIEENDDTHDWFIVMRPSFNSEWRVEIDHICPFADLELGSHVDAGTPLGKVGLWHGGQGRTELQISDPDGVDHCPAHEQFWDDLAQRDALGAEMEDLLLAWAAFTEEDHGLEDWVLPGCELEILP